MVAKSFQTLKIDGEPFKENSRMYVNVITKTGALKKVRWYSDAEYAKMYPGEVASVSASGIKRTAPLKETLGFTKGFIYIFKGDTYANLDWFRASTARYHEMFGWYIVSTDELPELPFGIEAAQLRWDDVSDGTDNALASEKVVKAAIEDILYDESNSQWVGEIGDRITIEVVVDRVIDSESYFGFSHFTIMHDAADNIYAWNSSSRRLNEGESYKIRGTIKDFNTYHKVKQTVLTRCQIVS